MVKITVKLALSLVFICILSCLTVGILLRMGFSCLPSRSTAHQRGYQTTVHARRVENSRAWSLLGGSYHSFLGVVEAQHQDHSNHTVTCRMEISSFFASSNATAIVEELMRSYPADRALRVFPDGNGRCENVELTQQVQLVLQVLVTVLGISLPFQLFLAANCVYLVCMACLVLREQRRGKVAIAYCQSRWWTHSSCWWALLDMHISQEQTDKQGAEVSDIVKAGRGLGSLDIMLRKDVANGHEGCVDV